MVCFDCLNWLCDAWAVPFVYIVSWICFESYDIEPTYINVNTARGLYGLSFPRGTKGPKRKKMVIEAVIEREKLWVLII